MQSIHQGIRRLLRRGWARVVAVVAACVFVAGGAAVGAPQPAGAVDFKEVTAEIPVSLKITGDHPYPNETFTFVIEPAEGEKLEPNPPTSITLHGDDSGKFTVSSNQVGMHFYKVYQVKGNVPHWTYDATVYTVEVFFAWNETANSIEPKVLIAPENHIGDKRDECEFENNYDKPWTPVTPVTPVTPTTPVTPETPDTPKTPETPETPDTAVTPDTATTPDTSVTPSTDEPSTTGSAPVPSDDTPKGGTWNPFGKLPKTGDAFSPAALVILAAVGIVLVALGVRIAHQHKGTQE